MKKLISLLVLIGILSALFISSGQTYEQQSLIPTLEKLLPSKPAERTLSKLEISYWGKQISVEERGYYYFVEFLLRKGAHFFSFGLLAATIFFVLPNHRRRAWTAGFLTLLLAVGDEYHQSLTGGRTPALQDVLLDMAGAITALVIVSTWIGLKKMMKRKRKKTRR